MYLFLIQMLLTSYNIIWLKSNKRFNLKKKVFVNRKLSEFNSKNVVDTSFVVGLSKPSPRSMQRASNLSGNIYIYTLHVFLSVCLSVCIQLMSKRLNRSGPNFVWDLTWPQGRFMDDRIFKNLPLTKFDLQIFF